MGDRELNPTFEDYDINLIQAVVHQKQETQQGP